MAKVYKNGIVSPKGFDMAAAEPTDQREIVEFYTDLTSLANCYPGIEVKVKEQAYKEYKLTALPSNLLVNWVESGGSVGQPGPVGPAGQDGADGKSAYELYVDNGGLLTELDWLASLEGADGLQGDPGPAGPTGPTGPAGADGAGGAWGSITGNLVDQTDLQTALDNKSPKIYDGVALSTVLLALDPALYLGETWYASDTRQAYRAVFDTVTSQNIWQKVEIINITYTELEDLVNGVGMVPGQSYRITNFKTSWTVLSEGYSWSGSDANVAKYVWPTQFEPLIVVANGPTTLLEDAKSEAYPRHLIKYDPDWNNAIDGAEAQVYTGKITYRKDLDQRVSAGFDFVGVWNPRYKVTTATEYSAASTYAKGARVKITNVAGDGLYISLSDGNIGNDPDADIQNWMIFRPQGADTTGLHRDYVTAGVAWIQNGTFGFTADLDSFLLFPTFAFAHDLTISDLNGGSEYRTYADSHVGKENNVFLATDNDTNFYGNYYCRLDDGFGNTLVTNYFYGTQFTNSGYAESPVNNYLFGALFGTNIEPKVTFENNYLEGLSFTTNLANETNNNVLIRRGVARNNWTIRGINANIEWGGSATLYNIPTWIHGSEKVIFNGCIITASMRNNGKIVLEDSEIRGTWTAMTCDTTGYQVDGSKVNPNNVFNVPMQQCDIKEITNCVFDGTVDGSRIRRWIGVTIPSNVSFKDCNFMALPRWRGQNVWSGDPLALVEKNISKRYVDNTTTPTLEKLWYEETDVNGVTNLIEIE